MKKKTINLERTSWEEALEAINKILPGIASFEININSISESVQNKLQEIRKPFEINRKRLITEGKIIDLGNKLNPDFLVRYAGKINRIIKEEIWGDWILELTDNEILDNLFGIEMEKFDPIGKIIIVKNECFPRISKEYEKCDFKNRLPYKVKSKNFKDSIVNFPSWIFDGDVLFINPKKEKIVIFCHEGAKFTIGRNDQ